ncbi:MAG: extracellular solute-binding protein [Anaerolineaceae bacterium]|nr:extracellular solute-binding protein [Anaerolineaceae bacterium]
MTKKFSRRQFLTLATATTAGAFLAACQPAAKATEAAKPAENTEPTPPPAAEDVSLNVWGWTDLIWTETFDKFTEQNPKTKINLTDLGENVFGDQKFLTAVSAGTGPDVAIQNRHTFLQFAAKKLYQDVTPYMEPSGLKRDDFTPVQIAETTWDGKIYGLPLFTDVRYLFWNRKHFEEVGLDPDKPPSTWDELGMFAEKLNVKNSKGDLDRIGFVPYLFGNSWTWLYGFINKAPAISDDKKTILCDDPRWAEALDWMVQFYDKYVGTFELANSFSEGVSAAGLGEPFSAGKVSMTASGDWEVGNFLRLPDLDWDCAPMPISPNGTKSTWSCGYSMVMAPQSKKAEQAWSLMKWTATEPGWDARAASTMTDTIRVWEREKIEGEAHYWPTQACYLPALNMLEEKYVSILGDKQKKAWALGLDALENWTHGCGTEMGLAALEYWVEMDNSTRNALSHKMTGQEAMDACKKKVQEATDRAWEAVGKA